MNVRSHSLYLGAVGALLLLLAAAVPTAAGGRYPTTTQLALPPAGSAYTWVEVDGGGRPTAGTLAIQQCRDRRTGSPVTYVRCQAGGGGAWVTIYEAAPDTTLVFAAASGVGYKGVYKGKQGYASSESAPGDGRPQITP